MIRAAAAALTLLTVTPGAYAAGLGRLTVLSELGQPFRGEVDLVSLKKDEIASLVARMGSPDAFRQADLPYTAYVSNLKVSVEKRPNGDPYVRISAPQPLNEPFIDFLVELSWTSGRLVRAYTALVDPPVVKDETETASAPEVKTAPPPLDMQVQPAPEASAAAPAPTESTGRKQKSAAKAAKNGARTAASTPAEPAAEAMASPGTQGGGEYGPVKRGQTLAQIARETRPADATLEQMLVLLYRNNPGAFEGKNMNRLRTGQVLRLPTPSEIAALPPAEALQEFRVQSSDWKAYRSRLADAASVGEPLDEPSSRAASGKVTTKVEDKAAPPDDAGKDVLKLSKGEPAKGGAAPAPVADGKTQERVRALEEEIASKGRAVADANQRIAQLEKQIKDMQALLEMKSKGMADLQKPAEKPAAPPPPPPPPVAEKAPEPPKPVEPPPVVEPPKPAEPPAAALPKAEAPPPAAEMPATPPAGEPLPAEPPPPPKKKFVPPPPPPPPSLVDQLLDNPMILGAGALVVAALGGLGFSAWKRKKGGAKPRPADDSAQPLDSGDAFGPAGFAPVAGAGAATAASAVQAATGTLGDESDALAEAEVFLIYGRDAQAEERLKEAIAANPSRYELHAKLLEIYAKRGDADAFEKVATELQQGTGGQGDLWQKAVQMGYQIDATNPRYAAGRIDEDSAEKTVPGGDDEATVQMPAFDAAPKDDLDFNLDFESTATGSSTDIDLGQLGADLERSGTTTTDIDLGLLGEGGVSPDVFDPSKTITRLDAGDPLAQTSEMAAFDPTATFAPVGEDDLSAGAGVMSDFDPTEALPPVSDFDPTATIAPTEASDLPTLPGLSLAAQGQQAAAAGSGLDFDLGTEDTEATIGGTRRVPQVSAALDDVSFDLDTLKLDSSPLEETSPGMMLPRTIPESDLESTRPGTDSATDLDLSGISLDLGDIESPTVIPTGAKDEKWYDVQTKFDLAKAYQEMGDKEGAREILEEVIAEGDEGQQAAARDLLDSLGN